MTKCCGTVAIDANERVGRLRQDQFAYEGERVLDVVLQGHAEMWAAMRERDEIYADAEAGEEAFLRAALAAAWDRRPAGPASAGPRARALSVRGPREDSERP